MKLKKFASSVLAASLLVGASGGVFADGIATAYLKISGLKFTDAGGSKLTVGTDLIFNSAVNNEGDTSATLNGTNEFHSDSAPASAAGLDILQSCVGACPYGENDFSSFLTKPTLPAGNYVVGDALLSGASVNFPGVVLPDVTAETLAEVGLKTGVGTAAGNNLGVQTSFSWIAGATGTMHYSYIADAYIRAALTPDVAGTQANASIGFTLTVTNSTLGGALVHAHEPLAINGAASRSSTVPGDDFDYSVVATGFSGSFAVVADQRYQLTIDHFSDANAEVIPEPASIAILGAGLLGMGMVRRRKRLAS
ncbi:PEP-CTERM sorting domain-containing protein [Pseudomaricurvus alkylphenolicus]|uniref:EDSAP-1 family PEP-CTERM protein n=1 Tax=Pseudomaricurvus alkylphenolicus TaxID=1306991 RepID=UPI00141E29C5|nr:EDSAP-1 family PEP-CTERM protein [Pseudomaricurvus alkylphenolicus]NIB43153.1 PEP-CTERM sorting domain-containing protein [Pseudomaricurvus alkylphenolicus]